jgi:hypothetical protein
MVIALLGAIGVMCTCFLPLGFTTIVRELREYREHPCEGIHIPSIDTFPTELEMYLSSSSSSEFTSTTTQSQSPLPEFCRVTQHGNVYEFHKDSPQLDSSKSSVLVFTGTTDAHPEGNVLMSYRVVPTTTTGIQQLPPQLQVYDTIRQPSKFTSVVTTKEDSREYLCFVAYDEGMKPSKRR